MVHITKVIYVSQVCTIKTQMNLVLLLSSGILGHQDSTENICNFAKVSYYEVFLYFHWQNKYKFRVSVLFGVRIQKG